MLETSTSTPSLSIKYTIAFSSRPQDAVLVQRRVNIGEGVYNSNACPFSLSIEAKRQEDTRMGA